MIINESDLQKGHDVQRPRLVSIVTPSYNQAQFIEQTLLSIKNQDYDLVEHIVVDGGSTDGTVEILGRYENTYNLRWISEPDQGQADAVNKGFAMATGEIIGWLNSDDLYVYPDVISRIVTEFSLHKDADIIYGQGIKINADGRILRAYYSLPFNYEILKQWCYIMQPTVFLRRHVIEQESLRIDLQYSMDYDFWLRLGRTQRWHRVGIIVAGDRAHSMRKSVAGRDSVQMEDRALHRELDYSGIASRPLTIWISKVLHRLLGGFVLTRVLLNRKTAMAIHLGNPLVLIKTQFFGKEHQLL